VKQGALQVGRAEQAAPLAASLHWAVGVARLDVAFPALAFVKAELGPGGGGAALSALSR